MKFSPEIDHCGTMIIVERGKRGFRVDEFYRKSFKQESLVNVEPIVQLVECHRSLFGMQI